MQICFFHIQHFFLIASTNYKGILGRCSALNLKSKVSSYPLLSTFSYFLSLHNPFRLFTVCGSSFIKCQQHEQVVLVMNCNPSLPNIQASQQASLWDGILNNIPKNIIFFSIYAFYAKLLISQQNASFISLSFDGGLLTLCPAANCNIGCEKANVFPTV